MARHEYEVGNTIEYRDFSGGKRVVLVEGREEDVKNGRSGFDGVVVEGPEKDEFVWGYDSQITRVIK